jgi:DNA polymerase-3 subunit beta
VKLTTQAAGLAATCASSAAVLCRGKNVPPILASLLLEADADAVRIIGTDLDLWATASCGATVAEPGRVVVPAGPFARFLAKLPATADVTIKADADHVRISAGRSRATLTRFVWLAVEGFPIPPPVTDTAAITLTRGQLERLFGDVAPFLARDTRRFRLTGVHLHSTENSELATTASDDIALRFATIPLELSSGALPASGVIVPPDALKPILTLPTNEITLHTDGCLLRAVGGEATVITKLIAGPYPDFRIPPAGAASAELERASLLAALEPMKAAANAASRKPMTIALGWHDGMVTLELGQLAADEIPATTSGAARLALAIDRLTKIIDALTTERLVLSSTTGPLRIDGGSDLVAVLATRI